MLFSPPRGKYVYICTKILIDPLLVNMKPKYDFSRIVIAEFASYDSFFFTISVYSSILSLQKLNQNYFYITMAVGIFGIAWIVGIV